MFSSIYGFRLVVECVCAFGAFQGLDLLLSVHVSLEASSCIRAPTCNHGGYSGDRAEEEPRHHPDSSEWAGGPNGSDHNTNKKFAGGYR